MKGEENRLIRRTLIVGVTLIFVACFTWNIKWVWFYIGKLTSIMTPITYGFIMAYLLIPMVKRVNSLINIGKGFERRKKTYPFSVMLVYITLLLGLGYGVKEVVPSVLRGITAVVEILPESSEWVKAYMEGNRKLFESIGYTEKEYSETIASVRAVIQGEKAITTLFNTTKQLTAVLTNILLGFILSIYMVIYKEKYIERVKRMMGVYVKGEKRKIVAEAIRETHNIFSTFVGAMLIEAWLVGILGGLLAWVVGVEAVVTIGILVGITNIVPYLGPLVGILLSGLVVYPMEGPTVALVLMLLLMILQQFDGHFIGPKIKGDSMGVDSLLVIASVVIATGLWGVVGTVVGAPVACLIYVFFKADVEKREERVKNGHSKKDKGSTRD